MTDDFTTLGDAAALVASDLGTFRQLEWGGERISRPGCYKNVPMERYHGDLCIGASVSRSTLHGMVSERSTPMHVWAQSHLNPDREAFVESEPMRTGRAAHALLLSEGEFARDFIRRPEKIGTQKWNANAGVCKEWLREQEEAGRTVLTPAQVAAVEGIANALSKDPRAIGLLRGDIERSLVWQHEATGLWLKARPDVLPVSDGIVSDLKVVADASPRAVSRSIRDYGYAMQAAMIGTGMRCTLNRGMTEFVLVSVEKTPPYAVSFIEINGAKIARAERRMEVAVRKFARCLRADDWPAYGEHVSSSDEWEEAEIDKLEREEAARTPILQAAE